MSLDVTFIFSRCSYQSSKLFENKIKQHFLIYFLVICILHLLQIDFLQATVSEYYINNSQYEKFEFLRLSVSMLRCVIFLLFQFCMLVKENKQQFVCFVYIIQTQLVELNKCLILEVAKGCFENSLKM